MNIGFVNKKFLCEGVNLDNIINSTATPFYLYSQKEIEQNYNNLNNTLFSEIFFSVKANSNQAILSLIKNLGAGADTVSAGEIQRCLKVGFNPDKIIYEGVSKSEHDIRYAIKQNIRLINIESLDEIPLINKIGQSLNKVVNVEILRDKRILIKRILIEELPEEEKIAGMKQNKIDKVEATGITVEDIDEKIKKKLNIYGGAKVIDISDDLTNNSKIKIDDIVTHINNQPVYNANDFVRKIEKINNDSLANFLVYRNSTPIYLAIKISN